MSDHGMRGAAAAPKAGTEEPRRELVTEAYERLRRLIVQGDLAPGMRLIEADLAQRFGMSRTPVRTALYILNQEGYVEATGDGRQSRLTVAPLTQDDALELFSLVGEIEGLAARRAAAQPPAARGALVPRLESLNSAIRQAATQSPPHSAETIRLDTEFHRAYVEAGGGRRLRSFHQTIKPQADRYIHLYHTTLTSEILVSTQEHALIIRALAEGDPPAAQRAVQNNWENAAARLSKSITRFGERGLW